MILQDYHIHTNFSPDCEMEPEIAVEAAIKAGMSEICFTDHMDLGHATEEFNRVPDFEEMKRNIQELQAKYPQIQIGHGSDAHTPERVGKYISEVVRSME